MKNEKRNPFASVLSYAGEQKGKLGLSVCLAVLSVACHMLPYIFVAGIIVRMIQGNADLMEILLLSAGAAAGYLLKIVFNSASTLISHKVSFGIMENIRNTIIGKFARSSMGFMQSKPSGTFQRLIMDTVDKLEYPLAHAIPELTSNLLVPVAILIYLFATDWRMALAGLAPIVIGLIISGVMMSGGALKTYKQYTECGEEMNAAMVEYVGGIEVVKAFQQADSSSKRYETVVLRFRDIMIKWFKHCWPFLSGTYVVTPASISFVLPIGALLLAGGSLTLEVFIVSLILTLGIAGPIMKLVEFTDNIVEIINAEEKINELLTTEELPQTDRKAELKDQGVRFDQVNFGYGETQVLKNISFEARAGETTALVGPSGSGKSTVIKLIARFWDIQSGAVQVGGVDVKDMPLTQLMDQISFVVQDNYLFDISIRENIRMGKPGATDEEVETAAEKACCTEFIGRFPEGFDTLVGAAGGRLSGGERQRIAIARAIIKDSPIVILDEATAFTDPESEDKIQTALDLLAKEKTLIIVAHRLSTIVKAHQIMVFDEGEIRAKGTHTELMETSPLYQSMWQAYIDAKSWNMNKEKNRC